MMVDKIKQREAAVACLWNTVAAAAGANLALATYRGVSQHLSGDQGPSLGINQGAGDAFAHCGPNAGRGGVSLYIDGLCLAFGTTQTLGRMGFGLMHFARFVQASRPSAAPGLPVSDSHVRQSKSHRRMVWALSSMESSLSCLGHLMQGEFTYQSCNPESWPLVFNSAVASLAALTFGKGFRASVDHPRQLDVGALQMAATSDAEQRSDIERDAETAARGTSAGDRTLAHVLAGVGLLCWSINAYLAHSDARTQITGHVGASRPYTFDDLSPSQKIETYASFAFGAIGVAQGAAIGLNAWYRQNRGQLQRYGEQCAQGCVQAAALGTAPVRWIRSRVSAPSQPTVAA